MEWTFNVTGVNEAQSRVSYSVLQGPAQDDDVTVEVLRKRRWLSEPGTTSNKASQETSEADSQGLQGPLTVDTEADNSYQITVSFLFVVCLA
ncbi:plexin domain-containing protein 2 isoform X1 [Tachysurus ichikawai]